MPLKNTESTYGSVAKTFHWLMFALITGLLAVGFIMTDMENGPDKFKIYGLHKSTGIIVLALALMRLGWKLANVQPLLPDSMRALEKLAARAGHWALYALMVVMPISGWMMSSAAGFPVSVFGLFTLPDLVEPDKILKSTLSDLHELLAYAIIFVVALHVLAALLHHYYHKDNVLRRMLPCLAAIVFMAFPAFAEAPLWTVDKDKSKLTFAAIQNNAPVEGAFTDFTATIHFDSEQPEQSSIEVEVNTGSVTIANEDVAKNIVLPEWLSTQKFPKATFKSKKITRTPMTDNYFAEGNLTLRGKTAPVELNFHLRQKGNVAIAEGFVTLKRNVFNVGQGEWSRDDVIKNEVRVNFRIFAKKSN